MQAAQALVRAGKLRGIAVTTPKRVAALPDVPAVAEALPGFEVVGWYGVIGPANMPRPIVARLHEELVAHPEPCRTSRERIMADGSEPVGSSPEEFRQFMLADLAKWAKVVKESGAKLDSGMPAISLRHRLPPCVLGGLVDGVEDFFVRRGFLARWRAARSASSHPPAPPRLAPPRAGPGP